MKHVIIGTAGHVDHGKTLLIKALTGIDTDRLKEEKKRGITIDLGFAHLDFEDGTQAGIVDVPGHEKFIKNMLAGAGGIDLAMLVVAADEGFMPQTVEHLGILTLLDIKDGLVVITKTDMVEPDWVDMIDEDVRQQVKGTFLEGKPILHVSSYTGEGIPELRKHLHQLVIAASEKNTRIPFRLPVDRVFSVDGFGTVVTGTLIEGCMHLDDLAELSPSGYTAKIRNLQVHGNDVDIAYAGQRVAVNLAGLKKKDIQRGDTVAKPGSVQTSHMLDVRLKNLKDSHRIIFNGSQVHLYHGSSVTLSKIVLLDRTELHPGESGYAQLRLSEPIAAKNGDRFVIRFFSPLETIGGGTILDGSPDKHKGGDQQVLNILRIKESGSGEQRIAQSLTEFGLDLPDRAQLAKHLAVDEEQLEQDLQNMLAQGKVIEILPNRFLSAESLDSVWKKGQSLLEAYHMANPLHEGISLAELRQKMFPAANRTTADAVLDTLVEEGKLRRTADRFALSDFEVHLTKRQAAIHDKLLELYRRAGQEPPNLDDVWPSFQPKEKDDCRKVLENLISSGHLVMLNSQIIFEKEAYLSAVNAVTKWFDTHETITLGEFRDLLNTSRKYALAFLEYFDKNKMTKKDGDVRRQGSNPIH